MWQAAYGKPIMAGCIWQIAFGKLHVSINMTNPIEDKLLVELLIKLLSKLKIKLLRAKPLKAHGQLSRRLLRRMTSPEGNI
jgi:hypothetical protein